VARANGFSHRLDESLACTVGDMDAEPQGPRSHLFTVRVWREDMGEGQWEWRGKVQHVVSGEAFYFREWQELIARLKTWLQEEGSWICRPR
jgi:hypothetical protein